MPLPDRIHILGASGSGTTSLALLMTARYGHRLARLRQAVLQSIPWVPSGSLCGWGDPLIAQFELVMFLAVPTPVRLARLWAREIERHSRGAEANGNAPGATRRSGSGGDRR